MKSYKLLCRILAKRENLLQVAQDFDILRIDGLKSEQEYIIIVYESNFKKENIVSLFRILVLHCRKG